MPSRLLSRVPPIRHVMTPSIPKGVAAPSFGRGVWKAHAEFQHPTQRIQARFKSTVSPAEVESESPPLQNEVLNDKGSNLAKYAHTPALDQCLPPELLSRLKRSSRSMTEISSELRRLFRSTTHVKNTLQGVYNPIPRLIKPASTSFPVEVTENTVRVGSHPIANIWLRDNCQCSECVHEHTKQRLLDTFKIPHDISIQESDVGEHDISIEWSDGHKSTYKKNFLRDAQDNQTKKAVIRQGIASIQTWDSSIASDPPRLRYVPIPNPDSHADSNFQKSLLKNLRKYGFCYIDKTPFDDPNDTKALLERISFIRPTHYGGFYDFTADLASKDTAYTNIALEAHTDTTYFSDPAGLQAFHLLSHTDGEGGASLLVDGFKIANDLHNQDRKAYEVLAEVNINCHASGNDGISIQPYKGFPVLHHDPTTGRLLQIRWNSSDRSSIELPLNRVEEWYDAARKWDALVKKQENEYWEQLTPGRVLIFDNWRVMHGRSAFTGKRRICGAYINRDDWISKYKMLVHGKKMVLDHLV